MHLINMKTKLIQSEWNLLNEIREFCEKYINRDDSTGGLRGSHDPTKIGNLEAHMAFTYKVMKDPATCQILKISPEISTLNGLENAMFSWLDERNQYVHKITDDGRHMYFADLSGCGPAWYPLPMMFREIWLDVCAKYEERIENYIVDFLYEYDLKKVR